MERADGKRNAYVGVLALYTEKVRYQAKDSRPLEGRLSA